MRIMLIDDSKTMRGIQRGMLKMVGLREVEEACDGIDALAKVDRFNPDLLIVDRDMPDMDGLAFTKAYRAQGGSALILLVLAESQKADSAEAIHAGVTNTIVKPFTPDILAQRIKETLDRNAAA